MSKSIITKRLDDLRLRMREEDIHLYLVSDQDFHLNTEPVEYFRTLEFISGFTGPYGRMAVTQGNAHLWTTKDLRDKAEKELEGTGIILHIDDDEDDELNQMQRFILASAHAILDDMIDEEGIHIDHHQVIGFDGRTFSFEEINDLMDALGFVYDSHAVDIDAEVDLIGDIWRDRPAFPSERAVMIGSEVDDISVTRKLGLLRSELLRRGSICGVAFTALDDIAWLFNIRGTDNPYDQTVFAYAYVDPSDAVLFVDSGKFSPADRARLMEEGVTIREYDEFYGFLENVSVLEVVVDPRRNNFASVLTLQSQPQLILTGRDGIIEEWRAIRSGMEAKNAFAVHEIDSLAMIRFAKWLQENVPSGTVTEQDASDKLWKLRSELGAIAPSMRPIVAYEKHTMDLYYTITPESNAVLEPYGFLLVQSGAHYEKGTTAYTYLIPLGPMMPNEQILYTTILAGLMDVCGAMMPAGLMDVQLDAVVRKSIWRRGMNYDYPSGYGVGNRLNGPEGPLSIDWRKSTPPTEIHHNMIMTIEPRINSFDILRVQTGMTLICQEIVPQSTMLRFNAMTMLPFFESAIIKEFMTDEQVRSLNKYHDKVWETMSPHLTEEEKKWLEKEMGSFRQPEIPEDWNW